MNPERQVAKLEGLLARIKRNAERPRLPTPTAVASPAMTAAPGTTRAAPPPPAVPPPPAPAPEPLEARARAPQPVAPPAPPIDELDEFGDLASIEPPPDDLALDEAEDLELIDDEIIDITDLDEEEAAAIEAEAAELEAVPSSSPRPKAAGSMDEALASAAAEMGEEREVPLKTPPPESGDQATGPMGAPFRQKPPADDLLEVGEELPQRDLGAGPTPEQLGETIELDEPLGPALELDTVKAQPPPVEAPSPLEEPIVSAAAGAFDEGLELPPEAAADMAKHRARDQIATHPAAPPTPAAAGEIRPDVVQRAPVGGTAPVFATAAQSFQPRSFGELLDASLSL
jgi:hypothetical protein